MIYITGDCHAEFGKLGTKHFPEQREMTRDDIVIVCGDFGIWHPDKTEKYWLKWLAQKNFTTVFCDGNHENYDRLYSDEFPIVDFHGGKAHQIRKNIYHLMRGYIFDFEGKKFFVFGGARSHDIQDGVLNIEDYPSVRDLVKDYNKRTAAGQMLRINHISWWEQEVPSEEEMQRGIKNLQKVKFKVDYVITHTLPQSIITCIYGKNSDIDKTSQYFDELLDKGLKFNKWMCGHLHQDRDVLGDYHIYYNQIERIL